MKTLITLILLVSTSSAFAVENFVCGISSNGKIKHQAIFDLDSDALTESFFDNGVKSLSIQTTAKKDAIAVSLGTKENRKVTILKRSTIQSLKYGKSFSSLSDLKKDAVVCFNMKKDKLTVFDVRNSMARNIASTNTVK